MPKSWTDVSSSAEYQALSPDNKEMAKNQYFSEVVMPQLKPDQVQNARSQFDSQTNDDSFFKKSMQFGKGAVVGAATGVPKALWGLGKAAYMGVTDPKEAYGQYVEPVINLGESLVTEPVETGKRIAKAGKKAYEEATPYELGKVAGEFLSPGAYKKVADTALAVSIGASNIPREISARALEKKGIKLEPAQVQANTPEASSGFGSKNKAKNQKIQNKEASRDTGRIADERGLNDEFFEERFSSLGKLYDKAYKGKSFNIDTATVDELKNMFAQERSMGPAGARVPTGVAKAVIDAHNQLMAAGGTADTFAIEGEGLQRLRTELQQIGRSSGDAAERRQAWRVIGLLDANVERSSPKLGKALKLVNKQYRATATLDNLRQAGGIQGGDVSLKRMGEYLRSHEFHGTEGQQELGAHATNVGLQARWERSPSSELPGSTNLIPMIKKALSVGGRTQYARNIQRKLAEKFLNKNPSLITTKDYDDAVRMMNELDAEKEPMRITISQGNETGLNPPEGFESGLPPQIPGGP